MLLKDRVALVTGASKGLGRAIALALAKEGAHVAVHYHRDQEGAEATRAAVAGEGRRSVTVRADLSRVAEIEFMVRQVYAHFGDIDILVNNASTSLWGPAFEVQEEDWDRVVGTHLKGTFFTTTAVARLMVQRGGGAIVNVSSAVEERALPYLSAYTAAKGGIEALTRQLAVELAPYGIRVNAFGAGPSATTRPGAGAGQAGAREGERDAGAEAWSRLIPLGRTGELQEMAAAVVFLASDLASFITGQVFYADGGWSIRGCTPGTWPQG